MNTIIGLATGVLVVFGGVALYHYVADKTAPVRADVAMPIRRNSLGQPMFVNERSV